MLRALLRDVRMLDARSRRGVGIRQRIPLSLAYAATYRVAFLVDLLFVAFLRVDLFRPNGSPLGSRWYRVPVRWNCGRADCERCPDPGGAAGRVIVLPSR